MVVQLLLMWNGYALHLQQGELADMFIAIADGSGWGADEKLDSRRGQFFIYTPILPSIVIIPILPFLRRQH